MNNLEEHSHRLTAISPLDGRYQAEVAVLAAFFSEAAMSRYRVRVEVEYLIFLARAPSITWVPPLTPPQQAALRALYRDFSPQDAQAIVDWDRRVHHDVKAVEYWLRERLRDLGMASYQEAVHFALTSEDVSNLAYGLIIREAREVVLLPVLNDLQHRIREVALAESQTAMLARTHGQPATPTTLGKEFAVFAARLSRLITDFAAAPITGKLNGASGTFAAHHAASPEVDWITFSRAFIRSLQLEPILLTTQIEPHDSLAALCDVLKRINTVLLDFCQDIWRYMSDAYLVQAVEAEEVGSSTMPHKVNPIDFENAEGNLGLANALLEFFSRKLPISRLQRDLSDSTVLRNLGVAWGYSLLAYRRILKGLARIVVNHDRIRTDLLAHPEVIAEAIQTILRRVGYSQPYEVLKTLTRGRTLSLDDLHAFLDTLPVDEHTRSELRRLRPETYTGLAHDLAHLIDP